ncbi:dsDNA nuclease domain-containing protein [Mammaliicoccus sciuri]|uniref:dsDNA nuclease domain-containing protein n=2 Tax=Mammaliicoccus sciuri TaxID=1296 RepID=UPI000E676AD3|nr:dsDNA nuclease domain-containing protein [Mammaliicoccus sciuri]RIN96565.1 DUF4297 domain-containing protein [Mammaliicoccus sciuri]
MDNGGAIATKGFNFQKTAAIYTIINYMENESFFLIPEADEDFQFGSDEIKYFIQCKTTKGLSISALMKRDKNKSGSSIIEKNLIPGEEEDNRWIFITSWKTGNNNKLDKTNSHAIFYPLLKFSEEQKKRIVSQLNLTSSDIERLKKQRLFLPHFIGKAEDNLRYLNGLLLEKVNVSVDTSILTAFNSELWTLIDQKSELFITDTSDISSYEKKIISYNHIQQFLKKVKRQSYFEKILDKLNLSSIALLHVKLAKKKIPMQYELILEKVLRKVATENKVKLYSTDKEVVDYIRNVINEITEKKFEDTEEIAIAVECYSQILLEIEE